MGFPAKTGTPATPPTVAKPVVRIRGAGLAKTETTIKDKREPEKPPRVYKETQVIGPRDFDAPYSMVKTGHATTMALNYQSITTTCEVVIPCANTPQAREAAAQEGWSFVEQRMAERAEWSAGIMGVMQEAWASAEGGKKGK